MDAATYKKILELPDDIKELLLKYINKDPNVSLDTLFTNYLNNGTYGLNALRTALTTLQNQVTSVNSNVNIIKSNPGNLIKNGVPIKSIILSDNVNNSVINYSRTVNGKILAVSFPSSSSQGGGNANSAFSIHGATNNINYGTPTSNNHLNIYCEAYKNLQDIESTHTVGTLAIPGDYLDDGIIIKGTFLSGNPNSYSSYSGLTVYYL